MNASEIKTYLLEINEGLRKNGQKGEIGIVGGAMMCLVYNARQATRVIDAIFEPSTLIRQIAKEVAIKYHLSENWLNDGAKAFLNSKVTKTKVDDLSNLLIWAPEPAYMLAMKCISARWDSSDADDVRFLVKHLKLRKPEEVFAFIQGFYPKSQIPPKTQFFIEELFEKL